MDLSLREKVIFGRTTFWRESFIFWLPLQLPNVLYLQGIIASTILHAADWRGSWRSDSRGRVLHLEKGLNRQKGHRTTLKTCTLLYVATPSSRGRYLSSEVDKSYFASNTLLPSLSALSALEHFNSNFESDRHSEHTDLYLLKIYLRPFQTRTLCTK